MTDKTGQRQYKFSLSIRDKNNRQVKRIVDGLLQKGRGALSQSIRDGLRLLNDLRRGNTKVLLEMFPDIVEKLHPSPPAKDDMDELKQMIIELQKRQPQVVYLPSDESIPSDAPLVGKSFGSPPTKQLTGGRPGSTFADDDDAPPATMKLGGMKKGSSKPIEDDEEDTIVLKPMSGTHIMDNFFASFAKLG